MNCNYLPDVNFLFFGFSMNDAIYFLDIETSSDEDDHDLAMLPPIEIANAETDMDSDVFDMKDMNDMNDKNDDMSDINE